MSQSISIDVEKYWDGWRVRVISETKAIDGMEERGHDNMADALRTIGERLDQAPKDGE